MSMHITPLWMLLTQTCNTQNMLNSAMGAQTACTDAAYSPSNRQKIIKKTTKKLI